MAKPPERTGITRRAFLGRMRDAAAAALDPKTPLNVTKALIAPPTPLAKALEDAIKSHDKIIANFSDSSFFKKTKDRKENTDPAALTQLLLDAIEAANDSMGRLLNEDRKFAQERKLKKGPIERLFEAQRIIVKLWKEDANDEEFIRQEIYIETLLKEAGIDAKIWHKFMDEMMHDGDALVSDKGIINYVAGEHSQYFMDGMRAGHFTDIAQEVAIELQKKFPVNVPYTDCAILSDMPPELLKKAGIKPDEKPAIGEHTQRERERQWRKEAETDDYHPFERRNEKFTRE